MWQQPPLEVNVRSCGPLEHASCGPQFSCTLSHSSITMLIVECIYANMRLTQTIDPGEGESPRERYASYRSSEVSREEQEWWVPSSWVLPCQCLYPEKKIISSRSPTADISRVWLKAQNMDKTYVHASYINVSKNPWQISVSNKLAYIILAKCLLITTNIIKGS